MPASRLSDIPLFLWVLLALVLLAQGTWVFRDAKKHGLNHWLWGLLCLLNTPTSLIVYLIVRNLIIKARRSSSDEEERK